VEEEVPVRPLYRHVRDLLLACRETHADEIDCDESLGFMSGYAEALAEGREVPGALTKVLEHERLCSNCREDCRALVDVLLARQVQGVPGQEP